MRLALTLLVLAPGIAAAQGFENLDAIDLRLAEAGYQAQPVDRRIRLRACPVALTIDAPALGAIAIRCPSLGWRIRVPLIGGGTMRTSEILVRRGDLVELAYTGAGFDVLTSATTQEDGQMGSIVRVKTLTGTPIVSARVIGPGRVVIAD